MHLKVAAEKNHPNAAFILSKMLGDKDKVSPAADNSIMDKAGSYELTKKAAELGVVDAQYDLGLYYINGEHFQEDRDLGLFWLSRAADAGHEKSALTRVKFLYNNHELQISYDSVRLRASEGHLPSMVILSQFYSNGWVVQRNEMKAHRLLSAAASMGSKEAIDLLRNGR
jgi:TPR repeat protein